MKTLGTLLVVCALWGAGCATLFGQNNTDPLQGRYIFRSTGFSPNGVAFSEAGEVEFKPDGTYIQTSTYNYGGGVKHLVQIGQYTLQGNHGSMKQYLLGDLPSNIDDTMDFWTSADKTTIYEASTDANLIWVAELHKDN